MFPVPGGHLSFSQAEKRQLTSQLEIWEVKGGGGLGRGEGRKLSNAGIVGEDSTGFHSWRPAVYLSGKDISKGLPKA